MSQSPAETRRLGEALGRELRGSEIICLSGEMGAGKTVFAQGVAGGAGVVGPVSSPTFSLVHEYGGRIPLWHVDAYRLASPLEALELGLGECLASGGTILIEWPERIEPALPPERLEVRFEVLGEEERRLQWRSVGESSAGLLARVATLLNPGLLASSR